MNKETVTIGFDIFEKHERYDHEQYYHFAEDVNGKLWKTNYGNNGDDDWYITCYENTQTGQLLENIKVKYYYKEVGKVPYEVWGNQRLENFVGKTLECEIIDGVKRYGFMNYELNVFYIVK